MNTLFIGYSILLIFSIASIYFLIVYTIKKSIKLREWLFILIGISFVGISTLTLFYGNDVNNKLNIEFKVPKDMYTNVYEEDSTITDKILYNHLLDMRVPHAKIVLCQAKIESASYKSVLFQRQYNLFGMKIPYSRPTSGNGGKAGYQSYNNWKESVTDYVLWQFSHKVDKLTQEDYLTYLGKIYAEDPNYVSKIRKMLKEINFRSLEY